MRKIQLTGLAAVALLSMPMAAQAQSTAKECLQLSLQHAINEKNTSLGIAMNSDAASIRSRSIACQARGHWAEINTALPRDEYIELVEFLMAILEEDLQDAIDRVAKSRAEQRP